MLKELLEREEEKIYYRRECSLRHRSLREWWSYCGVR
jgi:hypothetical protein